jgi:hypothetical protein
VSDAALTTRLNIARKAIGDSGDEQRLIKTLPRKGFRFVGPVQEIGTPIKATASGNAIQPPGPALALPDRPSIAVLPFQNLGGDPEQEYFADGMAEDITTLLSQTRDFLVIARGSTLAYKTNSVDFGRHRTTTRRSLCCRGKRPQGGQQDSRYRPARRSKGQASGCGQRTSTGC